MASEMQTGGLPASWTARQVVLGTLVVGAVAAGFWLLAHEQVVLFSLFEAIVIGTAIGPAVDWLHRRGVPRSLGVVLIYLLLLFLLAGFALLLVPLLAEQAATIGATFGHLYVEVVDTLRLSPSRLIRRLALRLPGDVAVAPPPPEANNLEGAALEAVNQALAYLDVLGRSVFVFVAVLVLAFYWTLDRERILRSLQLLAPPERREEVREFVLAIEARVGRYIRGLAMLSLIVGSLAFAAYLLLGLPYALLLGIVAGMFEAIPYIGPALGVLPAVLVAFAVAPDRVPWVLAIFAGIQLLENTFLVPRVMGRAVGVSPMVALLALIAFGTVFGLAGALLAVPLAAIIQLLLDRYILGAAAVDLPPPDGRDRLSILRYEAQQLIQDVRRQLRGKGLDLDDEADEVEDAIEALAADLDSLLARRSEERRGEA